MADENNGDADESEGDQNQYGGGDQEIDATEQTERMDANDDEDGGDEAEGD